MNEAVFISGISMWASIVAIMTIGLVGGIILVLSEKIAAKHRPEH